MNEYSFSSLTKRREKRLPTREERREEILDAAAAVFAARGYHRTTVAAIARQCGIADGTLYNHFDGKEALLRALLERLAAAESAKLDLGRRPGADFADLVRAYVLHRFRVLWSQRDLLRALVPELLTDPSLRGLYFERVVAPAQALGRSAVDAARAAGQTDIEDGDAFTRAVMGAALGTFMLGLLGDPGVTEDVEACAAATADLLLDGLAGRRPS